MRLSPITEQRRLDLLSVLFLLLTPVIFFWRETLGWRALGDQDAVFWFFPAYEFVVDTVRQGQLPLWYPGYYSGVPLFAQWQAGMLDPLNWIHFAGPTSQTLTISFQLGFALALVSTWIYSRQIGLSRRASVAVAIIYALSGFMIARTIYPVFIHVLALTPLMLAVTERLFHDQRWRIVALGALVVTWQVLAAHPQPLVYSSLLVSAYAVWGMLARHQSIRQSLNFLVRFAAIFILGAGLAAVQLLPAAEVAASSVRQDWSYKLFTLHSLNPLSLLTAVIPYFHGGGQGRYQMAYWGDSWHHNEQQIYLGLLALALAAGGAIFASRRRHSVGLFWIGVALAGLLLSLGQYVEPLVQVIFRLPVVGNFRGPHRHWMEVVMATAVLAGYAIDRLMREPREFRLLAARTVRLTALALLIIIAAVATLVLIRPGTAAAIVHSLPGWSGLPEDAFVKAGMELILPLGAGLISTVALWLWTGSRTPARWVVPILALLLVDYYLYAATAPITHQPGLEQHPHRALSPPAADAPLAEKIARVHVQLTPRDPRQASQAGQGEFSPYWFANRQAVTGYDPLLDRRYKNFSGVDEAGHTWLETILLPRDRTLDLLNARYLVLSPDWPTDGRSQVRRPVAPIELAAARSLLGSIVPGQGDTLLIETRSPSSAQATIRLSCGSVTIFESSLSIGRSLVSQGPIPQIAACRETLTLTLVNAGSSSLKIDGLWLGQAGSGQQSPFLHPDDSVSLDPRRWIARGWLDPASPYAGFRIYENRQVLPRAWLVERVEPAWEGDQLKRIRGEIRDLEGNLFDPATTALVDMPSDQTPPWYRQFLRQPAGPDSSPGSATLTHFQPGQIDLTVEALRPAILILSENPDSGWQATIDGQPTAWYRVNFNQRGLVVPAGQHQVRFLYRPLSIKRGAVISSITALILTLMICLNGRMTLRSRSLDQLTAGGA